MKNLLSRITRPMFSAYEESDPMSFFINLLWILGFGGLVVGILGLAGVIGGKG